MSSSSSTILNTIEAHNEAWTEFSKLQKAPLGVGCRQLTSLFTTNASTNHLVAI